MYWFIDAFYKYAQIKGRSQRAAFWWFVIFALLFSFVLGMGDGLFETPVLLSSGTLVELINSTMERFHLTFRMQDPQIAIGLLEGIYIALILIPSSTLLVRRLHDIGRSAWWLIIGLVPILGILVLLVFTLVNSQTGINKYGPNPKGV